MTDVSTGARSVSRVREVTPSDVHLPPTEPIDVTAIIAAAAASGQPGTR